MRIGVLGGRAVLVRAGRAVDAAEASGGQFGPDVTQLYERWGDFQARESTTDLEGAGVGFQERDLACPVPEPRQAFAVGLNYAEHAGEVHLEASEFPSVFTKFRSALPGPYCEVVHPGGQVDYEVELVVVIGRRAYQVDEPDGWEHVAGMTIGQDLSERITQFQAQPAQFSLGKSFPGFAPIGPVVVTPDEFENRDDLVVGCDLAGEQMQRAHTSQMLFTVPQLVAQLSAIAPLLPGDLIFTGTPGGVGLARKPQRWIQPGEVLRSYIEGIGELEQRFTHG